MSRLLILLLCLGVAAPVAAQVFSAEALATLDGLGVPDEAASLLFTTEAEARTALGAPSSEETYPDELTGGPDFRVLKYALPEGRTLTLTLCTDSTRVGLSPSQVFCEVSVTHAFPTREAGWAFQRPAEESLAAVASASFAECDVHYYTLGRAWVSVQPFFGYGDEYGWAVVLEPSR